MDDIIVFDATLRDGSHAIKHQLTIEQITDYCQAIDDVGFYATMVGHGNGLGASTLQSGMCLLDDNTMLTMARLFLKKTRLGVFMIPGYGTIKDNLIPAINDGVNVFKIGTHCTEADTAAQHIEYLSRLDKEVYGVLMLSHYIGPNELLIQAERMQSYGAQGVILMDSAGAMLPMDVAARITLLVSKLKIRVGFHAHNNMSMAVANTLEALLYGATIIDGTVRGFGAGAGNCQLEAILTVLKRKGIDLGVDLPKLLDVSENIVAKKLQQVPQGISSYSIMSGYSGVVSTFTEHVKTMAKEFNVDPMLIFEELGKRRVVAGQEDSIIDVASALAKKGTV